MICVAVLFCALAQGQARKPVRPPELEAFVNTALSLPAEYASDLILGAIEAGAIQEPQWKRELLEAVFQRAFGAKNPYPRRDVGTDRDTASGRLGSAFDQQLDSLSIRCRVVNLLLPVSRVRARELFAEIPPIRLPVVPCRDPLVYDVAIYYRTLTDLYNRAFEPAERQHEEDWAFLRVPFQSLTAWSNSRQRHRRFGNRICPPASAASS